MPPYLTCPVLRLHKLADYSESRLQVQQLNNMADAEAKAKAEKLAAAKKRVCRRPRTHLECCNSYGLPRLTEVCSQVEALKKQKAKKTGAKTEDVSEPVAKTPNLEETPEETPPPEQGAEAEDDAGAAPHVDDTKAADEAAGEPPATPYSHQRKPSLSVQSKMRSSSFRQSLTSPLPNTPGSKAPSFDPEEDTAPEIYRKQAARIEELERENKRLAKEATEGEKRWKKAEEELEDLREADGTRSELKAGSQIPGNSADELTKLVGSMDRI